MNQTDITIAEKTAQGYSQRQIEAMTGINDSTVARRLAKHEVQEYIDKIKDDLISRSLPKAAANIDKAIQAYSDKDSDAQLREHGFKASQRVLESVGILPSHSPQINITGDVQVTPIIAQIIQQFGQGLILPSDDEDGVIDVGNGQ